jgi:hypothetical protein
MTAVAHIPRPSVWRLLRIELHRNAQVASPAVSAAAARFGALPAAARHAWLAAHLAALRAGRITLAQLP